MVTVAWVEGNVANGAVGELIFHIRYSYANNNPVNLTDPSGLCAQPTQWWNPVDVNCYYSAAGLAERFSGGNSQAYDELFDLLIQKDWAELKTLEFWGSAAGVTGASRQFVDNAAIIPRLFRENPQAALMALQQFGCQNQGTILGAISILIVASAQAIVQNNQLRLPSGNQPGNRFPGLGIGVAVIGGVVLAVGGLILWDELTHQQIGNLVLEARITPRDSGTGIT